MWALVSGAGVARDEKPLSKQEGVHLKSTAADRTAFIILHNDPEFISAGTGRTLQCPIVHIVNHVLCTLDKIVLATHKICAKYIGPECPSVAVRHSVGIDDLEPQRCGIRLRRAFDFRQIVVHIFPIAVSAAGAFVVFYTNKVGAGTPLISQNVAVTGTVSVRITTYRTGNRRSAT